jgi:protein SCO1/2
MVPGRRGVVDDMRLDPPSTGDVDAPDPPDDPPTRSPARRRLPALIPLVVIALVLGGVTALLTGKGSNKPKLPSNVSSTTQPDYAGAVAEPTKAAPPIRLRDSLGRPFDLTSDRGHVVLVTFLYVHCPDICPLIAANLRNTRAKLGPLAKRVRIVAVSVDPRGDTPKTVAAFLEGHGMTGAMRYLLGSAGQLGRVWQAWNVGSQRDTADPNAVAHSALVYGVSAKGLLTTLYPANFKPADIVHDVPKLLAS